MGVFGSIERTLADLYPYRVPLTLVALALLGAVAWWLHRAGWSGRLARWSSTHRPQSVAGAVLALAVVIPLGYYLLSPLWTRSMLFEESPLAAAVSTAADASMTPTAVPVASTPTSPASVPATSTPATPAPVADAGGRPSTVLHGTWEGADDFHFAQGDALIIETAPGRYVLRVENFSVRNGPDLFVYVSPDPGGYTADAINLGALKATDGAFNYEVPAGVTLEEMRSAVVWCRQFAVQFGAAPLAP